MLVGLYQHLMTHLSCERIIVRNIDAVYLRVQLKQTLKIIQKKILSLFMSYYNHLLLFAPLHGPRV